MEFYRWAELPEEQLNPLASRQMIHTGKATLIRRTLAKGSTGNPHRHVEEQISVIQQGTLRFLVDETEQIVTAGEVLVIPSNALHSVEALEDTVMLDLFARTQTSP